VEVPGSVEDGAAAEVGAAAADVDHGVDRGGDARVVLADPGGGGALQRGEADVVVALVGEDEADRFGAETAVAVVQDDRALR